MPQQDFNAMQARAIKLAREMQQRATPSMQTEASPPAEKIQNIKNFPPPKDVFSHHNPWTQERETPFCKNACPIKNILSGPQQGNNNDVMMLMGLLMLISADGGDKMLMLALLYIMT